MEKPKKGHEWLTGPDRWVQKHMAVNADDRPVGTQSSTACRRCLLGILLWIYEDGDKYLKACERVMAALNLPGYVLIQTWNDAPERTWEEVRDLLVRADA